jgi:hypothetical protein
MSILEKSLPTEMATLEKHADWTAELRRSVASLIDRFDSNPDTVDYTDYFLDLVALPSGSGASPDEHVAHIVGNHSPADVFDQWEYIRDYAAVRRLDNLADVIGDATSWTPELREKTGWWLMKHGEDWPLVFRVAYLVNGHEAVPEPSAVMHSEACVAACGLMDVAQPNVLLRAWLKAKAEQDKASSYNTRWIRSWAKVRGIKVRRIGRLARDVCERYVAEVMPDPSEVSTTTS